MIAPLFQCHTYDGSERMKLYVSGLVSSAGRKNMEQMSEVVPKAKQQQLQQFLSASPWPVDPVWKRVSLETTRVIDGGSVAMLMLDESAFSKKGKHSVGVARQHNGRLGKVDNCQVGVFSALSHHNRTALTGARLYLPKEWASSR